MGQPTKVQVIQRKNGPDQWYVNFPTAVAHAMQFVKGETVEWIIEDKANVVLHRQQVPPAPVRLKKRYATPRRHRNPPERRLRAGR